MKQIILSCVFIFFLNHLLFTDGTLPEGTGTEEDPYLIATLDNLLYLSTNEYLWSEGYHFSQTDDIDASDTQNWNVGDHDNDTETPDEAMGFSPIGIELTEQGAFTGSYNGQGHFIDSIYINDQYYGYCVGFFSLCRYAEISNLGLTNVNITGEHQTGGLVATTVFSEIQNCYVTGNVEGNMLIGGIVGYNASSIITECYSICNIVGRDAGGLVGNNSTDSMINNCYSEGSVTGHDVIGGLAGRTYQSTITNSYSTCNVTGSYRIGGFVGENGSDSNISKCYSIGSVTASSWSVGGFIGNSYTTSPNDCFWDRETSGQQGSIGATGKTTAEMQDVATYTNLTTIGLDEAWDFVNNPFDDTANENIWDIDQDMNYGYPYLTTLPLVDAEEEVIPNSSLIIPNLSNHPNPFNPATTITFDITSEHTESTEVHIYNVKGQQVDQLRIKNYELGMNKVIWNAERFASGVYFYKLNVKDTPIKKMVLLK
jgi:hypothetical protein